MQIHFWGVRGSIPAPLNSAQIRSKIAAVVEKITSKDIASADTKERFLASLPPEIFGTVGGNTACVEMISDKDQHIIFDAGSGLREFGLYVASMKEVKEFHILFSHFHWDHIQGLPFFSQLFNPNNQIHFYSPDPDAMSYIEKQMGGVYFPVPMIGADFHFHCCSELEKFNIGDFELIPKKMCHPGGSYSFSVVNNGKKVVYATDSELQPSDFDVTEENIQHFKDADVLIFDAQYTTLEALDKVHWGHSSFSSVIDFAIAWNVKKIMLFHHEPTYNDKKIMNILNSAKWYSHYVNADHLDIELATEGSTITV